MDTYILTEKIEELQEFLDFINETQILLTVVPYSLAVLQEKVPYSLAVIPYSLAVIPYSLAKIVLKPFVKRSFKLF